MNGITGIVMNVAPATASGCVASPPRNCTTFSKINWEMPLKLQALPGNCRTANKRQTDGDAQAPDKWNGGGGGTGYTGYKRGMQSQEDYDVDDD